MTTCMKRSVDRVASGQLVIGEKLSLIPRDLTYPHAYCAGSGLESTFIEEFNVKHVQVLVQLIT